MIARLWPGEDCDEIQHWKIIGEIGKLPVGRRFQSVSPPRQKQQLAVSQCNSKNKFKDEI